VQALLFDNRCETRSGTKSLSAPTSTSAEARGDTARAAPGGEFVRALDLKPGSIVGWGLVMFLAGFALVFPETRGWLASGLVPHQPEVKPAPEDPLANECRRALENIRFQRSYSSGWSGALKIPAGLEISTSMAISLAQRQESLPEIVQEFRRFVERTTLDYRAVVIAIDELDKLGSHEKAERFLNEIKAIFNISNCFYLASVSENAISTFERRGMRFRDAFDSAFDDITYVDYLSLQGSRNLLARRVLNLPMPFVSLCHSLSAGLPRDLIRITRTVLDYAQRNPTKNRIGEIATAVMDAEILRKLRATAVAARDIPLEPESATFLASLAKLEGLKSLSPGYLCECRTPAAREGLSDEERTLLRRIENLARELASFLRFAITATQLFASLNTEAQWDMAVASGLIERLAKARQALELSSGIADARISDLRVACKLSPLELD